jgi:hypothetical protein
MPKKINLTIKERVIITAKDFEIPAEKTNRFLNSIMELIERAKSPDLFCSKCDERMSINLEAGMLTCFNCGFEKAIESHPYTGDIPIKHDSPVVKTPSTTVEPNFIKPNTQILKAIDKLERDPTPKKTSILALANSRGGAAITEEDEAYVKNSIPGAKNSKINWVK